MPVFINEVIAEVEDTRTSETRDTGQDAPPEAQSTLEALALAEERQRRLLVD